MSDRDELAAIARDAIGDQDETSFDGAVTLIRRCSPSTPPDECTAAEQLATELETAWKEAHGPHELGQPYCDRCDGLCRYADEPYGHDTEAPSGRPTGEMAVWFDELAELPAEALAL